MKLIFYEILTQIIVIAGRIREIFEPVMYERRDRICGVDETTYPGHTYKAKDVLVTSIRCCDCGAWHYFWVEKKTFFGMAIRPRDYKYKLRLLGCKATLATKEMRKRITV